MSLLFKLIEAATSIEMAKWCITLFYDDIQAIPITIEAKRYNLLNISRLLTFLDQSPKLSREAIKLPCLTNFYYCLLVHKYFAK